MASGSVYRDQPPSFLQREQLFNQGKTSYSSENASSPHWDMQEELCQARAGCLGVLGTLPPFSVDN